MKIIKNKIFSKYLYFSNTFSHTNHQYKIINYHGVRANLLFSYENNRFILMTLSGFNVYFDA